MRILQIHIIIFISILKKNADKGMSVSKGRNYTKHIHLGSTSLITDLDGNIVQHIEYVPFGEVFIEERNNKWNTTYLFNAKKLDEETGLYYYGAKYYEPRVSLWLSADPMQEKYPNISPYAYCANNPINAIDPDGRDWYADKEGKYQYNPNLTAKNQSSILAEGEKYVGVTARINDSKGNMFANFRADGSIMFANESAAYARMIDRTNQTTEESMAVLTDKGTLVLPDYKNHSTINYSRVDPSDYGYSFNKGNVTDALGNTYNTIATVHTHPGGGGPSDFNFEGTYGDAGFAAIATPYKPVYVLEMDDRGGVSYVISGPNPQSYFIQLAVTTIANLINGKHSLVQYSPVLTKAYKEAYRREYKK